MKNRNNDPILVQMNDSLARGMYRKNNGTLFNSNSDPQVHKEFRNVPKAVHAKLWRYDGKMLHGKHSGKQVRQLPLEYAQWIMDNVNLSHNSKNELKEAVPKVKRKPECKCSICINKPWNK